MIRAWRIAFAALIALSARGEARAAGPWRPDPMIVRFDSTYTAVVVGNFTRPLATAGADLLVIDEAAARTEVRPFHDLLARTLANAFTFTYRGAPFRSGYLAQDGADALADVVQISGPSYIQVAFGNDRVPRSYSAQCTDDAPAFLHLLPRSADVLVLPLYWYSTDWARLTAVDFDVSLVPTIAQQRSWQLGPGGNGSLVVEPFASPLQKVEAAPIRLSDTARRDGVDDVALLGLGGVVLFLHAATPRTDLSTISFNAPIEVGGTGGGLYPPPGPAPWLPTTVPNRGDALGIAAIDVNLDGALDLVFPQSLLRPDSTGEPAQGAVVWVEGSGNPADFADWTLTPWHDLGLQLGLVKPLIVRQVEVDGTPAAAIWDRGLQEVIVVWPDYASGTLQTWRAPAPGQIAADIRLADLVGSPAKDLVVVMDNTWVSPLPDTVLVYPDVGLPSPALAWAPGSPGTPMRGEPHTMEVVLDPSGPATVTVDWVEGAPTNAPVWQGLSYTFPADCTSPPPDLVVTVRATDDTGVFTELSAVVPVAPLQPAISLRGATPPGRLVLDPEHATTAVFDGVAAWQCGATSWGGAWPVAATVSDEKGPGWLRRTVALPQAAYPGLLSDPDFAVSSHFAVSLATSDPGAPEPVVTLPVEFDGSQLVEVIHESDRTALAEGEVAMLRTRLRNRIGYALPEVQVVDVLAGLSPAGEPSVTGAAVLFSSAGGAELVLDMLPAAPAEVVIELPVRSGGGQGASAVEVWSRGQWPLTPPARADAGAGALPGCGCGAGGAGGGLAALALLLAGRRRSRGAAPLT